MSRPLVSVLTPTYKRAALLGGAIETVRAQSYRPLEHVVVIDGPDDLESMVLAAREQDRARLQGLVPLRWAVLGKNWSSYLPASFCAAPVTAAMLLAGGEYQAWLADDERMHGEHLELLVGLLESESADFAYGRVAMWAEGGAEWEIGRYPPECGQITNAVYRTELLRRGLFVFGAGGIGDWATIERWMQQGARAAFLDRVTLTHRADH